MGVALDHSGVGPAHEVHDGSFGHAEKQQGCRCRVPGIVESGFADARRLKQSFPLVLISARVDRLAGWLGEHPAAFMPLGAGVLAFLILPVAVLGEQREQLLWQGDAASSRS